MTRRDYELIARIIRKMPDGVRKAAMEAFATDLHAGAAGFNKERFIKACEFEPENKS